jgi:DNA-binding NarL/FixJ family response regulator
LLEQQPEWQVVGEAANAFELLDQAKLVQPDLVLLDGELPGIQNGQSISTIRKICPGVCIVALVNPPPRNGSSINLRADGYATIVNSPDYLLNIIRNCLNRRN